MSEQKEVGRIEAIKLFFESNGGRKVTMEELKVLKASDRDELGTLCAERLGLKLKAS